MRIARSTCGLPTVHASVSTNCQHRGGGFLLQWSPMHHDNVSTRCQQWEVGPGSGGVVHCTVRSDLNKFGHFQGWGESLYSEVQCIMGNGHMGPLSTDRHEWKHYLPAAKWQAVIKCLHLSLFLKSYDTTSKSKINSILICSNKSMALQGIKCQ